MQISGDELRVVADLMKTPNGTRAPHQLIQAFPALIGAAEVRQSLTHAAENDGRTTWTVLWFTEVAVAVGTASANVGGWSATGRQDQVADALSVAVRPLADVQKVEVVEVTVAGRGVHNQFVWRSRYRVTFRDGVELAVPPGGGFPVTDAEEVAVDDVMALLRAHGPAGQR